MTSPDALPGQVVRQRNMPVPHRTSTRTSRHTHPTDRVPPSGVCLVKCVTAGFHWCSPPCDRWSAKGTSERVRRGLPPSRPSYPVPACGVGRADGRVEAFQCGLLVGEVPARPDGTAEPGVRTLDRVGRAVYRTSHCPGRHAHRLLPPIH